MPSRPLPGRRWYRPLAQIAFIVLLVWAWQWASSSGHIDGFFFGRPSMIWSQLTQWFNDGTLFKDVVSTGTLLVAGFMAGIAAGSVLGVVLAMSRLAKDVLEPYLIFLNAVPRIILYPFLVVWLGLGITPKLVTIVFVLVPTVAINIAAGLKDVEGEYLDNMRALGASRWALVTQVYAPSLTLWILSTCRVTFALAFQAALLAELIGSTKGLGFLVVQGQDAFDINEVYAALVLVVILAIAADLVLTLLERRATRWMPRG